jgi:putative lipoic acid-binding regulatory protein
MFIEEKKNMKNIKNIEIITSKEGLETDGFYAKFKEELDNSQVLPGDYMFKFVIPSDSRKIAQLNQIFDDRILSFSTKESKGGKYTSVTAVIFAINADTIIKYYKEAAAIDGIMML